MAKKRSQLSTPKSNASSDDLQLIRGIGPALANRLNDAGIHTFNRIASMTPAKLASQVNGLSVKQITRQDWIGQAGKLVHRKSSPKPRKEETATPTVRQHYQNFTLEFLLDENNLVRRTRVVHIQSRDADTWSAWEAEQLLDFLARHVGVRIQTTGSKHIRNSTSSNPISKSEPEKDVSIVATAPHQISQPPSEPSLESLSAQMGEFTRPPAQGGNLAGILKLYDLRLVSIDSDQPISSLRQNQPHRIQLDLDLSQVIAPEDALLKYTTIIKFKKLGGSRYPIDIVNHFLKSDNREIVSIMGPRLPPGIYRMYAFVSLTVENQESALTASLKGELFPIY